VWEMSWKIKNKCGEVYSKTLPNVCLSNMDLHTHTHTHTYTKSEQLFDKCGKFEYTQSAKHALVLYTPVHTCLGLFALIQKGWNAVRACLAHSLASLDTV
jgi:hypothetical protein